MKSIPQALRLTADERVAYDRDGYVLREAVFDASDVSAISAVCEAIVDDLTRDRAGHRIRAGSYVFDPDLPRDVLIKWEGDSDIVHGIEPCAHLSPKLEAWALDDRFVVPMQDLVGDPDPELFTEKLNLKRPHHGGVNPLHQDFPYWVDVAQDPHDVATAMLFLDDADLDNGCLCVVPGSHTAGMWSRRTDGDAFAGNEIDAAQYADVESVPLEVGAGAVVMFGSLLAHHSAPNHSDAERRALLFSYQPAGRPHMVDSLRQMGRRASGRSQ